jgi:hypothetical protein
MGWTRDVPQLDHSWAVWQAFLASMRGKPKCWWCGQCPGTDDMCVACGEDEA